MGVIYGEIEHRHLYASLFPNRLVDVDVNINWRTALFGIFGFNFNAIGIRCWTFTQRTTVVNKLVVKKLEADSKKVHDKMR